METAALPPQPPPTSSPRPRRRWWPWLVALIIAVSLAGFIWGGPLIKAGRSVVAARYAESAAAKIKAADWNGAVPDLTVARRWDPEHPDVLRALADFMIGTKSDPLSQHLILLKLADLGRATPADLLLIAKFHLTQGDPARARTVLEQLPESERTGKDAQELLANVLRVEGRTNEAHQVLRHSLQDAADPSSQLRLALLDYQTPFPEVRAAARDRIWALAEGAGQPALQAIEFLAIDSAITEQQGRRLLALLAENHPTAIATRFRVNSAIMRLLPAERERILTEESASFGTADPLADATLLRWLIDEREFDRALKLLPPEVGKAPQMLELRFWALAGAERWSEIERILVETKDVPLTPERSNLWRAKAAYHTLRDPARTQQLLLAAFEAAGHGQNADIGQQIAAFAEEAGLWNVAATCYRGLAQAQPTGQVRNLEKVHEMALRQNDTDAALQSARWLAAQNPANPAFGERVIYYQLVAGQEMELAAASLREHADTLGEAEPVALIHALAAFRMGDSPALAEQLARISEPGALTPGQRAVLAGLLATAGETTRAFRVGEKIPISLLLPEERWFLQRAL